MPVSTEPLRRFDDRMLDDIGVTRREGTGPFAAYERRPEIPARQPRRPVGTRWFKSIVAALGATLGATLERDGLVKRTIYPTVPPRVDYELTEMGRSLHPTLQALSAWVHDNRRDIEAARAGYDLGGDPHVGSLEDLRAAELSLTRNSA